MNRHQNHSHRFCSHMFYQILPRSLICGALDSQQFSSTRQCWDSGCYGPAPRCFSLQEDRGLPIKSPWSLSIFLDVCTLKNVVLPNVFCTFTFLSGVVGKSKLNTYLTSLHWSVSLWSGRWRRLPIGDCPKHWDSVGVFCPPEFRTNTHGDWMVGGLEHVYFPQ